jgi:hypothetical protein
MTTETLTIQADTTPTDGNAQVTDESTTVEQAENAEGGTSAAEERLFGGEFKTVEELEAAYAASKTPAVAQEEDAEAAAAAAAEAAADEDKDKAVADALTSAGLDQTVFTEEFASTGTLSEDSFKSLADKGYPRELVDVYLDGLKARQANYQNAVYGPAGGESGYKEILAWAGKNLEADEIAAFNDAVTSGDAARAKLAVAGLTAQAKGTRAPSLLQGRATAGGIEPFKSRVEVQNAMRDPRYARDPAYRNEISERLRVSEVY